MKKNNPTFHRHIIHIFIGVMLICVIPFFIYCVVISYLSTQERNDLSLQGITDSVTREFEVALSTVESTSILLISNEAVRSAINAMQSPNSSYLETVNDNITLTIAAALYTTSEPNLSVISYYDANGNILATTDGTRGASQSLFGNDTMKEMREELDDSSFMIFDYSQHNEVASFNQHLMYVRPVSALHEEDPVGYLAVFIDMRNFKTTLSNNSIAIDENYGMYIVNNNTNNILISGDENGNSSFMMLDDYKYYVAETSDEYNITVYLSVPNHFLILEMFGDHASSLVLASILVILGSIVLLLYLNTDLEQIFILNKHMKSIEQGNYSYYIEEKSQFSDIQRVYTGFNRMLFEIDELINNDYKNKLLLQETQLKIFRLQMNPHFLYNSLQYIESAGELSGVPQISDMASSLGKLLRYNLKNTESVLLSEEVDSCMTYLQIQKLRFGDKLDFEFFIDPNTINIFVPKFILQPLAENCITHAFRDMSISGRIEFHSFIEEGNLHLEVSDNGCGFPSDFNLDESSLTIDSEWEHIGLANVIVRIKQILGEQYGLSLLPTTKGAKIKIILPVNIER